MSWKVVTMSVLYAPCVSNSTAVAVPVLQNTLGKCYHIFVILKITQRALSTKSWGSTAQQ